MAELDLDAREAAKLLGISVPAVHRLCNRGTLNYRWFAGRRVFGRDQISRLVNDEGYQRRTRKLDASQLKLGGLD